MTIASVEDIGAVGVITDQQSNKLPFNAWSSVKNARFENNEAKRVGGYSQLEVIDGAVIWALPLQYGDYAYWITCSTEKIYAWDGNTNTDITRGTGDMTGGVDDQWNGGIFAGIAVMNNGIDIPQYWAPGTSNAADLIDWDSTWQAQVIRPYKNMLIAMDMTENGTRYPTKYRWSNIADPGSIPDWDETDPANQAGSDVIEETQGFIVDGEALRDSFILYKEDSFFQLQFIGGEFVIANRMILKTRGLLAQRCVKEFYGKHFVVSNGDIFVHDGQNAESVVDGRVRRKIFDEIDSTNYKKSFVTTNWINNEL